LKLINTTQSIDGPTTAQKIHYIIFPRRYKNVE
jgi:hypothetical protein